MAIVELFNATEHPIFFVLFVFKKNGNCFFRLPEKVILCHLWIKITNQDCTKVEGKSKFVDES